MKKDELKLIILISIILAVSIGIIQFAALKKELNLTNGFRAISFGITLTTFFWAFYFSFGWRVWGLNKIFYRPNLNGTWSGVLESDWTDSNGKQIGEIDFFYSD